MRNSEALAYLSTSGLNYEIVYFDKVVDQKNALYNGEVNLISSVSLSPPRPIAAPWRSLLPAPTILPPPRGTPTLSRS